MFFIKGYDVGIMDKKNYDSAEDVDYALAPILEMEMKNE